MTISEREFESMTENSFELRNETGTAIGSVVETINLKLISVHPAFWRFAQIDNDATKILDVIND